ncbi:leucine-rich repeat domain-containing protein [Candidatus Comchoanobacter bicostacola]|uniref:Leucine-rich repeat domain-containing protein n=1 Tax=Candidatus Comchoanobacter bicostacola TaxID=2919598 RepID=A0ABY5DJC7_9GAMM|nr:leucine-rich repeat domain-containing protein [Candidatus Comchoanobacter bicostacola]UTC24128.1 leucine-rich repeat domain-containing protein [Candidatus Comchoanobacter bicostacola]
MGNINSQDRKVGYSSRFIANSSSQSIVVKNDLRVLQDGALRELGFVSVRLPRSLTVLEPRVFWECKRLESIYMQHIDSMGAWCFQGCKQLANVYLSGSLKLIAEGVFYECIALKFIYLPASVRKVESNAFAHCCSLEEISVPYHIQLSEGALWRCTAIQCITLTVEHESEVEQVNVSDWVRFLPKVKMSIAMYQHKVARIMISKYKCFLNQYPSLCKALWCALLCQSRLTIQLPPEIWAYICAPILTVETKLYTVKSTPGRNAAHYEPVKGGRSISIKEVHFPHLT